MAVRGSVGYWINKGNVGEYNVKAYNAVGDGVTDDTQAIQSAINALQNNGGGVLKIPSGCYKITSQLTCNSNIVMVGEGIDTTIIDASSISSGSAIHILGNGYSSITTLTADASESDTVIEVNDASKLKEWDIITITSNEQWNPARPEYKKGEFNRIRSISGNTITLNIPLRSSYDHEQTTISLLVPISVAFRDFELVCDANIAGLYIAYGSPVNLNNIRVYGATAKGISIAYSYDIDVTNVTNYKTWDLPATTEYGVVVSNSQDIYIANCTLEDGRHCIDITGSSIVSRDARLVNNYLVGRDNAMNTHGNVEYISIENNQIYGGCHIGGDHIALINNKIQAVSGRYYTVWGDEITAGNINISGNEIISCGNRLENYPDRGVILLTRNLTVPNGYLRIINNKISTGAYNPNYISIINNSLSGTWENVEISNNICYSSQTTLPQNIYIYVNRLKVNSITVVSNIIENGGIYMARGAKNVIISNNIVKSSKTYGILVFGYVNIDFEEVVISNNIVYDSAVAGIAVVGYTNNTIVASIIGNVVKNSNMLLSSTPYQRAGITVYHAKSSIISNNVTFDDQESKTQAYGIYVYDCVQSRIANNQCNDNTINDIYVSTVTNLMLLDNKYSSKFISGVENYDVSEFTSPLKATTFINSVYTFSSNNSTPSVSSGTNFKTNNSVPTTITDFDGGVEGQFIRVFISDNKTTIDFTGTNLKGNANTDWTPSNGDYMECTKIGNYWYCSVYDCT